MSETTSTRGLRRGLGLAAAVTMGAMGLFAGASPAIADNITGTSGSITIHKYENPGNGQMNPDGSGVKPGKALAGVTFEACHIDGINLLSGNNTGWDQVNAITGPQRLAAQSGDSLGSYSLSNCTTIGPTDAEGSAASGTLDLGAYLVREIDAPANVVKTADPFVVTVPTPSVNKGEGDGTWVYDVNVYPKNTVGSTPVKRIEDQTAPTAEVGSKMNFSVSQVVPGIAADETYKKFTMTDALDARLTGDASSVNVFVGATQLAAADFTATVNGQDLNIELTASGLAKLAAGDVVRFEFAATINSMGDGELTNQAFTNINDMDMTPGTTPGEPENPENPTNEVKSRWGQAKITKVGPDSTAGLAGAEFEVLMGSADKCDAPGITFTPVLKTGTTEPLVVTSDANGVVNIPALWIGNDSIDSDGNATIGLAERCYQFVEKKAPNGYVLPSGNEAITAVAIKPGETANSVVKVVNVQQEVPELPLTGAQGQLIMAAGGLVLVGGASALMVVSRRKKAQANA